MNTTIPCGFSGYGYTEGSDSALFMHRASAALPLVPILVTFLYFDFHK